MIYSIWRLTTRKIVCHQCLSEQIVPTNTPRGQSLVHQSESSINPAASPLPSTVIPQQEVRKKKGASPALKGCLIAGAVILILAAINSRESTRSITPSSGSGSNPSGERIPEYKVVSTKDVNYANVKRKAFRIRVDGKLEVQKLKQIAQKIIDDIKKDEEIDAAMFHFYLPNTEVDGPYTAGMVVWGANGKWGNEDSNLPHSFTVTTGGLFDGRVSTKTADRFTEQVRRSIFEQLIRAERQATKEAEAQFPGNFDMQGDAFESKNNNYKSKIVNDNHLSKDELKHIIHEGIRKNWSPPVE